MGVGGPGGREGPKQPNPLIPPLPFLWSLPPLSPLRHPASNAGRKIDPTLKSATPSVPPRPKFLTLSAQPRILKSTVSTTKIRIPMP